MERFLYTWLPRVFGCHCRPDRSFYYKGKKFPLCARCTGELAGVIMGIALYFVYIPKVSVLAALMLPMILDGLVQLFTRYESNNGRRFWTGLLFGYALVMLLIVSSVWTFELGKRLGMNMAGAL